MSEKREIFVSVDVETAGPIPGEYSLLSIGACLAFAPEEAFSCQLKPIGNRFDPKALEVTYYGRQPQRRAELAVRGGEADAAPSLRR